MRDLIYLSCVVLVVSCADESSPDRHGAASGTGGAGSSSTGGSAAQPPGPQTAGTGGTHDVDNNHVVTSGTGGANAAAKDGGRGGRDAGADSGAHIGHDAGQGAVDGSTGSGGSAASMCGQLNADYAAALEHAQTCDSQASGQCQQQARRSLGCYCMTTVNDAAPLDAIYARYMDAGCPADPGCKGIFCTSPGTGTCAPIDRGDVCQ